MDTVHERKPCLPVEGVPLRYRVDRTNPWSFLDARAAHLARRSGQLVAFPRLDQVVTEVTCRNGEVEFAALLWDLSEYEVDILIGREAALALPAFADPLVRFPLAGDRAAPDATLVHVGASRGDPHRELMR